jgi:uncharacterized protein
MRRKIFLAYAGLLVLVFIYHSFQTRLLEYLLPVYLLSIPVLLTGRINAGISLKQIIFSLLVSAVLILPLLVLLPGFFSLRGITFSAALVQFFFISLPEEVFFRGFVQDKLRNDLKGVVIVSFMFAAAHSPALVFHGDLTAPLTFFPSLVMGFLYWKTSSVLPPAVFHLFSNLAFTGEF